MSQEIEVNPILIKSSLNKSTFFKLKKFLRKIVGKSRKRSQKSVSFSESVLIFNETGKSSTARIGGEDLKIQKFYVWVNIKDVKGENYINPELEGEYFDVDFFEMSLKKCRF